MTHTDLLKTFQWHCLNKKFIHLQQRKPSTLMNWLIRIKKGRTRTKVDRKVPWSNMIRTSFWTVLLTPRKHCSSYIPTSKIWTLESVPWVFVLRRFDCILPCKNIHCRSTSSVAKHPRFRSYSQTQYSVGTLHTTTEIRVLWQTDKPDARFQHFLINECCSPHCSATFNMLNELALIPL